MEERSFCPGNMVTPILASDFEGVEIIFFVPAFFFAVVVGLFSIWKRSRPFACISEGACIFLGLISLLFACFEKREVALVNACGGIIYLLTGVSFIYFKRRDVT
jgi:hypothetical protein